MLGGLRHLWAHLRTSHESDIFRLVDRAHNRIILLMVEFRHRDCWSNGATLLGWLQVHTCSALKDTRRIDTSERLNVLFGGLVAQNILT